MEVYIDSYDEKWGCRPKLGLNVCPLKKNVGYYNTKKTCQYTPLTHTYVTYSQLTKDKRMY